MGQPVLARHGICEMFYARMIPKFLNLTQEKCVYRGIFGKKLRMEDILLNYFEQIVCFCAIIY